MMHNAVVNVYGEWNFAGLYAGGKSGTAENGGGKAANAVFAGFLQDSDYPLAFTSWSRRAAAARRSARRSSARCSAPVWSPWMPIKQKAPQDG